MLPIFRAEVDFVFHKINNYKSTEITGSLIQIEDKSYIVEEIFLPLIQSSDGVSFGYNSDYFIPINEETISISFDNKTFKKLSFYNNLSLF